MRITDELERLAKLHAGGLLSDEEFAAAKRRLLAEQAAEVPGAPGRVSPWHVAGLVFVFAASAVLVLISLFVTPKFEQIFQDMLGGEPLPVSTRLALGSRLTFVGQAAIFCVGACVAFGRKIGGAVMAVLLAILAVQIVLCVYGLFAPLISIVTSMQAP